MADSSPEQTKNREREQAIAREILPFAAGSFFSLPLGANWVADLVGWRVFFLSDARIQFVWAALVLGAAVVPLYLRPGRAGWRGSALLPVLLVLGAVVLFLLSAYQTFAAPEADGRTWYELSALAIVLSLFWRLVGALRGRAGASQ